MDFNTIETPAQLVEVNESVKSPLELAKEAMMMDNVDWSDNREMIEWLLVASTQYHRAIALELRSSDDEDDNQDSLMWAADAGKLESMLTILGTIE